VEIAHDGGMCGASIDHMKLREIMRHSPATVTEADTLGHAHDLMMRFEIRHLPVLRGRRVVGILTERDLLKYRAESRDRDAWTDAAVTDAMVAPAQTAGPDDSLTEAEGRFAAYKIGAIPIVDEGDLVGLVR
jgi:CBS domain-containing protein